MKKIALVIITLFALSSPLLLSQVVDGITYQAVALDENGKEIAGHDVNGLIIHSKQIDVRFSLISGTPDGELQYMEEHSTYTDPYGMFSLVIGHGEVSSLGKYQKILDINWGADKMFLKVEIDIKARGDYKLMGIQQMMAVPFALHALSASVTTVRYEDILDKPALFSGNYGDLLNKPALFSGSYDDLLNKPSLFSGNFNDLTNKPLLFSGSYNDLSDKPALFNGNYNDLQNKPSLFDGTWASLTGKPAFASVATSGSYNDLSDKPALDGSETKVTAGANTTVTGKGTTTDPYVISSAASGAGSGTFSNPVGSSKDGGIVFFVYKGNDGQEHGLILGLQESVQVLQSPYSLVNANRTWDGAYNTSQLTSSPAKSWVESLGAGWYIPSIEELKILYNNRYFVDKALFEAGQPLLSNADYWSSTERSYILGWHLNFETGTAYAGHSKSNPGGFLVRPIRAF
ncbi:MAG: DUF1566 domain-containing protein [Bacteroidales bacterium]|nr:DUF1566 domain-containing protein [Bacteroidales bacterium]